MRFLQLSDIHFNEKSDGWSTRKLREELIPYLKGLNFSVDDLLITGDFRDARSKSDTSVTSVVEYIKEIAAAVQIEDVRHIHLIPGNHDRARKDGDIKRIEKIRQKYNAEHGRFPEDDLAYMLEQFDDFNIGTLSLLQIRMHIGSLTIPFSSTLIQRSRTVVVMIGIVC